MISPPKYKLMQDKKWTIMKTFDNESADKNSNKLDHSTEIKLDETDDLAEYFEHVFSISYLTMMKH